MRKTFLEGKNKRDHMIRGAFLPFTRPGEIRDSGSKLNRHHMFKFFQLLFPINQDFILDLMPSQSACPYYSKMIIANGDYGQVESIIFVNYYIFN